MSAPRQVISEAIGLCQINCGGCEWRKERMEESPINRASVIYDVCF